MPACIICQTESNSGFLTGDGFTCSEDCSQIVHGRVRHFHDHLFAEPLTEMPERFETADFERWVLKFAVHFLRKIDPEEKKALPVFLTFPDQLALEFKERLLKHLNPAYVSSVEHKGHARMFSGGTYCLRQPVPAEVLLEAARQAQMIQ